jgi:hypothetical protein
MFSKDLESTFEHVTKTPLVLALTLAAAGCTAGGSPAYPHAASDVPNPFIEVAPAGAAARAWGSPVPGHLVFRPMGSSAIFCSSSRTSCGYIKRTGTGRSPSQNCAVDHARV